MPLGILIKTTSQLQETVTIYINIWIGRLLKGITGQTIHEYNKKRISRANNAKKGEETKAGKSISQEKRNMHRIATGILIKL